MTADAIAGAILFGFVALISLTMGVLQLRTAYGKADYEGWPFASSENRSVRIAMGVWMLAIGTGAVAGCVTFIASGF